MKTMNVSYRGTVITLHEWMTIGEIAMALHKAKQRAA